MIKKVLSSCLAVAMAVSSVICIPFSAMADDDITLGNYKYKVVEGNAEIVEYIGTETDVVIPDTLDEKPVVKIGNGAFQGADLQTLTIGNNLTEIYPDAFYDCHSLSSVKFGNNVEKIYSYVFVGCNSLKSVTLPKSVTFVGECAFPNTTAIKCYSTSTDALEYAADNGNKCTLLDKKSNISKVSKGKKSFKMTWKKVSSVSGYQIAYSTSKNFTKKTTKTITVKGSKTTSKTISKLKSKKKYYVRIRAYKNVKALEDNKIKKFYASWSSVRTVKTK